MKLVSWLPVLIFLSPVRPVAGAPAPPDPAGAEFFEKEIRPLLVSRCQTCHGATQTRGGLRLTRRDLVLKGGGRGPAVVAE